uniref:Integrase, catalytic region, zinc finger, CCHC-type, peptidase aspartic, catalytic n=1 Tax=Tanacetum cinerariifolium TaxID=118510 RepID=A0A6L2JLS2_TANCI|nr:hypothetical protein [Tanacetum cinerariifolium]
MDTQCASDTLDLLSHKLEDENVELEFQVLNYPKENSHLKTTYKNLFDSIIVLGIQKNDRSLQYDSMMNEIHMQSKEGNVDSSKALDTSLVVTECSAIESENSNSEHAFNKSVNESSGIVTGKRDTSNSSGNYITHAMDADIRPANDQVPFAEVQLTAQHNDLANEQQHTEQSEPIYDTYLLKKVDSNTTPDSTNISHRGGEIDQDAEQYQKCVFNANHDDCTTKLLKEVNSRAKVQSPKSRNNIKLAKRIPNVKKPKRWISKGYRWIPTGKMFTDSTTKVDSEPPNGSNDDITNPYECDQTLNAPFLKEKKGIRFSALYLQKKINLLVFDHSHQHFLYFPMLVQSLSRSTSTWSLNVYEMVKLTHGYISSGLLQNSVSPTPYVPPSKKDYKIMFQPLFDEYFNPPPCVVSLDPTAVAAPRAVDPAGSPSSTTIDQDVPSASTSPTTQEI